MGVCAEMELYRKKVVKALIKEIGYTKSEAEKLSKEATDLIQGGYAIASFPRYIAIRICDRDKKET